MLGINLLNLKLVIVCLGMSPGFRVLISEGGKLILFIKNYPQRQPEKPRWHLAGEAFLQCFRSLLHH